MAEKKQEKRKVIRVYPEDDLFTVFTCVLEEQERNPDKEVVVHDPSGYANAVYAIAEEITKKPQE